MNDATQLLQHIHAAERLIREQSDIRDRLLTQLAPVVAPFKVGQYVRTEAGRGDRGLVTNVRFRMTPSDLSPEEIAICLSVDVRPITKGGKLRKQVWRAHRWARLVVDSDQTPVPEDAR